MRYAPSSNASSASIVACAVWQAIGLVGVGALFGRSVPPGLTFEAILSCATHHHPTPLWPRSRRARFGWLIGLVGVVALFGRSVPPGLTFEAILSCATHHHPTPLWFRSRRARFGRLSDLWVSLRCLVTPTILLRRSVPAGQTYEAILSCATYHHPTALRPRSWRVRFGWLSDLWMSLRCLVTPTILLRRSAPAGQTYEAILSCATHHHPTPLRFRSRRARFGRLSDLWVSLRCLVTPAILLRRSVPAGQTYEAILSCATHHHPTPLRPRSWRARFGRLSDLWASLRCLVTPAILLRRSVPAGQTYEAILSCATHHHPTPLRFRSRRARFGRHRTCGRRCVVW